jgi:hypothetical protein
MTTPEALLARLDSLAASLSSRDDALALLALGSVGAETVRLDEWSDLDFFVLVANGAKARYVQNLDWLANAHPLAWSFQNTIDGHKALMADGVFCEFAVFEVNELQHIPYTPGRFIWRRNEAAESLALPKRPLPMRQSAEWLVGEALSNLIIGLQRHARGEKLAAMRMVQVYALDRVLEFLETMQPTPDDPRAMRDPFNVDRRIEMRCQTAEINLQVCSGGYEGTVRAALELLAVLETYRVVPKAIGERIRDLA